MENGSSKKNDHIVWIDIAKGIGCILVVLGHFWYKAPHVEVLKFIYSFHVPLFFICAGFVFKIKKESKLISNVCNKVKRLIIPSIFFIIMGIIMKFIVTPNIKYDALFEQIVYWKGTLPFNAPVWFFITIFEVYLIIYIYLLISRNRFNIISAIVITIISFLAGYLIYKNKMFIPFGLNRAIYCLGYFTLGFIFRYIYNYFKDKKNYKILLVILFIICTTVWVLINLSNGKVSIYDFKLRNYWLSILGGVSGSISILVIAYLLSFLKKSSIFVKISSMSIFLIGTHYIPKYYLQELGKPIWFSNKYMIYVLVVTAVLIAIYIPICNFLDKHFPIITGKMGSKKTS